MNFIGLGICHAYLLQRNGKELERINVSVVQM
jgi:hypothetical protein